MSKTKHILKIEDIADSKTVGGKTFSLKRLYDHGFNIPLFIAIPTHVVEKIDNNINILDEIVTEIKDYFKETPLAIRSSALIEDSRNSSHAGQFLTKTNVRQKDVRDALIEVIHYAKGQLNNNLEQFSIIVQEFIKPETFGVIFTRNPIGTREMQIEYGTFNGNEVVGGSVTPDKLNLYWNSSVMPSYLVEVVKQAKSIEEFFSFPQDIEWCIRNNNLHILQSRPITTITDRQYTDIKTLEELLPSNDRYYFERTTLTEMAPYPSNFTFDLLRKLYKQSGPVDNVYRKHNIKYKNTNFLIFIGNTLYVDKDKEVKSLLPVYTFKNNTKPKLSLSSFSDLITTLKNIYHLNTIKTDTYDDLYRTLTSHYTQHPTHTIEKSIEIFLKQYETVFEINLLAGITYKKMEVYLKNEPVLIPDILTNADIFINTKNFTLPVLDMPLIGNSIDISDESAFIFKNNAKKAATLKWWNEVSIHKKKLFKKIISKALVWNIMREMSRQLVVKNISIIRQHLLDIAKENKFSDIKDIYFATIEEIINNRISDKIYKDRKNVFINYSSINYPYRLMSWIEKKESKLQGVSSGIAYGVLTTKSMLLVTDRKAEEKVILYTDILSPDISLYFDKISGIVSNYGGSLSHMAIVAREHNIPVVVGFDITKSKIKIGSKVEINGSEGTIIAIE